MLDHDVGKALVQLNLATPMDASSDQIERILEADRRRAWRWTTASVALWVIAALGALSLFVLGGLTFPVVAKLLSEQGEGSIANADTPFLVLARLVAMSFVIGTASFGALVAAGLSTVVLLVRSRRATLRQINANLMLISAQLQSTASS